MESRPSDEFQQESIDQATARALRAGPWKRALWAGLLWATCGLSAGGTLLLFASQPNGAGFLPWGLALLGAVMLVIGAGLFAWVISPEKTIRRFVLSTVQRNDDMKTDRWPGWPKA